MAARSVYRATQIAALSARTRGVEARIPPDNPMPPCPPPLGSTFCHQQQKADHVAAASRRGRPVQKIRGERMAVSGASGSGWASGMPMAPPGHARATCITCCPPEPCSGGPADQKSVRQENDGARMGARDLRASQGKVVGRDYPILHRSIRSRVIACERADERSSEKPHGRPSRFGRHRANRWRSNGRLRRGHIDRNNFHLRKCPTPIETNEKEYEEN